MLCSHDMPAPTLGIGTVQFGLPYGISNSRGQTAPNEVRQILRDAWQAGVRYLDTAHAYGTSEEVLGATLSSDAAFRIVTKLPSLPPSITATNDVITWVRDSITQSLERLGQSSLYGVLVHNPLDAIGPCGSAILDALHSCKQSGEVAKIGISIYEREQLEAARRVASIDLVQAPINLFDQRLLSGNFLSSLRREGVEIHVRSIFLQGLLLMSLEELPNYFTPFLPRIQRFHHACRHYGVSPMAMAMAFIKTLPVDVALVGINTHEHLKEITTIYHSTIDALSDLSFDQFAIDEVALLNPSAWQLSPR